MAYLWIFCIVWSCVLALSIFVLPYKYLVPACCQKTCLLGMMGYGVNGSSCPMIQFVHYFGLQTVKINLLIYIHNLILKEISSCLCCIQWLNSSGVIWLGQKKNMYKGRVLLLVWHLWPLSQILCWSKFCFLAITRWKICKLNKPSWISYKTRHWLYLHKVPVVHNSILRPTDYMRVFTIQSTVYLVIMILVACEPSKKIKCSHMKRVFHWKGHQE